MIYNSDSAKTKRFAIECKFAEAYTSLGHSGIKPEYIDIGLIWEDIPNLYDLAKSLCPDDRKFRVLHPAQLVKHILGLKRKFGKEGFIHGNKGRKPVMLFLLIRLLRLSLFIIINIGTPLFLMLVSY